MSGKSVLTAFQSNNTYTPLAFHPLEYFYCTMHISDKAYEYYRKARISGNGVNT